ncbi:MAG: flagellar export protein FliJ [Acidimicrobiales bacterium]
MKRYVFRLQGVLQLRRAEEAQAREVLGAANARLRQAITARDVEVARYRRVAAMATATSVETLRAEMQGASLAAETVAAAREAVSVAAADTALAQVAWTACSRKVKILERLDERRRAEHAEQAQRAEIAVVDDIVTARYLAEQRSTSATSVGPRTSGAA